MKTGGDFLGKGTYGCVFKPAVDCVDGNTYPDKVGKVFFHQIGYDEEKNVDKILGPIDPDQKYLLYPSDKKCKVTQDQVEKADPRPRACGIAEEVGESPYDQMVMNDGGFSLDKYLDDVKITRRDACRILYGTFAAVDLLVKHKLVHQDIKDGNIVVDAKGQSKLIDFGFLMTFKAFSQQDILFASEYYVNGPEYRLVMYEAEYDVILMHLQKNLQQFGKLTTWRRNGLDIVDEHYLSSLNKYIEASKKPSFKHSPEKADIYALGILMASMARYLVSASNDDQQHVELFKQLVYVLLRPDPKDRPTASEALTLLTKIRDLETGKDVKLSKPAKTTPVKQVVSKPAVTSPRPAEAVKQKVSKPVVTPTKPAKTTPKPAVTPTKPAKTTPKPAVTPPKPAKTTKEVKQKALKSVSPPEKYVSGTLLELKKLNKEAFKGIGITYLTDLQNGRHGGRKLVHAKDVFDHHHSRQWMGAQEKKYHALLYVLKKLSGH